MLWDSSARIEFLRLGLLLKLFTVLGPEWIGVPAGARLELLGGVVAMVVVVA